MVKIPLYGVHDFTLIAEMGEDNRFRISCSATFEHESGVKIAGVPGFYNGGNEVVIRFSPSLMGRWQGRTVSEMADLNDIRLPSIEVTAPAHGNARGVLRVDAKHPQRFCWQDGTPFIYLGFECDWLFAYHQADPELCREHLDLIANRGFSAIITNVYAHTGFSDENASFEGEVLPGTVYAPPEIYLFGGTNDAPDHATLNVAFFRDFDRLMHLLHARGIVVHLMLQVQNKHVAWPARDTPEDDQYWQYVVARYQAFGNVIWDIGKESYNLLHETGSHGYTVSRIDLVRTTDAYDHLVTVHDAEAGSSGRVSAADLASDVVSDQIHLADVARYNREAVQKLQRHPGPYINIEYGYELGAEPLKTYRSRTTAPWEDVLKWTYALYLAGAYPGYYYSNTSWDLIRFEPEPPGWQRYRYLKELLDSLPFNEMRSANELVDRGYCLARWGQAYLVYLPEGGDAYIDLTDLPHERGSRGQLLAGETRLRATWMNIYTGERHELEVAPAGWMTRVIYPFEKAGEPVVLALLA
jgi:hypothetical protein